jgi:tripartite motif-containing protein 71
MKPRFTLVWAMLVILGMPCLLPEAAWAQAPTVLAVWDAGQFWHPEGVAVDSVGNVYIANGAFRSIDIWSHEGAPISRFGGEGTLYYPARVAFGADGLVYVADAATGGTPVYKSELSVWRDGLLLQRIGTWGHESGQLAATWGVAVYGGRLYVADTDNHRVSVFTVGGEFITCWPTKDACYGLAIDGSGRVFVADIGGSIDIFTVEGTSIGSIGSPGIGPGQLQQPRDVALDALGRVYVADSYNHRIVVFNADGTYLKQWGTRGSDPGQFIRPEGVAVGADGLVYIADTWNDRIQVFGPVPVPVNSTSWGRIKALYR